jgi:hypothetical protein
MTTTASTWDALIASFPGYIDPVDMLFGHAAVAFAVALVKGWHKYFRGHDVRHCG